MTLLPAFGTSHISRSAKGRDDYLWDKWCRRTLETLLTDVAPRVASLGRTGYYGCGFHYDKVQQLGSLIRTLAIPPDYEVFERLILEVKCEGLFKETAQAEASRTQPPFNKR